ncbi:MAG: DNA polymerase III subunit delta [Bifidobacteriaceae bacterium]|nr:DNA polymerase III subunit delta [Bifidobacteriaceae bacterium]
MSKKASHPRVLLVSGSESYLAERAVRQFQGAWREVYPDASLTTVGAAELDAGQLAEITGSSLFADTAIVVVTEIESLPDDLHQQVAQLAQEPGEDLILALVHSGGAKGKALVDKLRKLGVETRVLAPVKAWQLPEFLQDEARAAKGEIGAQAAAALVDAVGSDLRALSAAVRQLLDDSADGHITMEQINRYFAGRAEVTSFAVADAAIAGNLPEALSKLRWAAQAAVPSVLVTSAFARSLTSLGRYIEASSSSGSDAELAKVAGVPVWRLRELSRLSRTWRPANIAAAIRAVAQADAEVKGAGGDPEYALERLVLQVHSLRSRS